MTRILSFTEPLLQCFVRTLSYDVTKILRPSNNLVVIGVVNHDLHSERTHVVVGGHGGTVRPRMPQQQCVALLEGRVQAAIPGQDVTALTDWPHHVHCRRISSEDSTTEGPCELSHRVSGAVKGRANYLGHGSVHHYERLPAVPLNPQHLRHHHTCSSHEGAARLQQ